MQFIYILNIDIKELKAKELDVTYEFDPSLDSSSELDLSLCFAATSTRIRVTRFCGLVSYPPQLIYLARDMSKPIMKHQ